MTDAAHRASKERKPTMLNSKPFGHETKSGPDKLVDETRMKNTMKVEGGKMVKGENYRRVIESEASSRVPAKMLRVQKKRFHEARREGGTDRKLLKHSTSHLLPEKEDSAPSTSTFSPIITSVVSLASGTPMMIKGRQRVSRCSDQELKNTNTYRTPKVIKNDSQLKKTEIKGAKRFVNTKDTMPQITITTKRINRIMSCISSKLSSINHMCLSTDSIRGLTKGKSYTQVMGHFHDGLSLQSVSLGIIEIADNTPVASVTQAFADICEKWKISPVKVTAVVSSLNYCINEAVKCLFGKNKFLYCFADLINRVASKIVGEQIVKETFWKVKEIGSSIQGGISGITNDEDIFLNMLESQNGNWVSDYKLLEKYLEYSQGKYSVFSPQNMLNKLELFVTRDVRDILKIMYLVILEFSQGEQTYSSEIIPMVSLFKKKLSIFIPLSAKGKDLKNKLEKAIYEKFKFIELVHPLSISTILDPRFKNLYFENSQAAPEAVRQIINLLEGKMNEPGIQQEKGQGQERFWDCHDVLITKSSPVGNASEELRHFLNDPILSRTDTDPIQYWVQNAKRFPNLFRVANSYLCVPGTSVPRMKLNLKAGMKFGGKRGKAMLEKLLFLHSIPKSYLERNA